MKYAVLTLIVFILIALVAAGVFMIRDRGRSKRTFYALALRVGLSLTLFLLLMIGYRMGWIKPHFL